MARILLKPPGNDVQQIRIQRASDPNIYNTVSNRNQMQVSNTSFIRE